MQLIQQLWTGRRADTRRLCEAVKVARALNRAATQAGGRRTSAHPDTFSIYLGGSLGQCFRPFAEFVEKRRANAFARLSVKSCEKIFAKRSHGVCERAKV